MPPILLKAACGSISDVTASSGTTGTTITGLAMAWVVDAGLVKAAGLVKGE